MTLPLLPVDNPDVQFNFDKIAQQFLDTGGQSLRLRAGSSTTTYPGGSPVSNTKTVTHGLGSTPIAVVATEDGSAYSSVLVFNRTATTFDWKVRTYDGTSPALNTTDGIYWIAIG